MPSCGRAWTLPRCVSFGVLPFSVAMVAAMTVSAYVYLQR